MVLILCIISQILMSVPWKHIIAVAMPIVLTLMVDTTALVTVGMMAMDTLAVGSTTALSLTSNLCLTHGFS